MTHSRTETVAWDTARLDLDEAGRIIVLRPNVPLGDPAQNYLATPWKPFCSITTGKKILKPAQVNKTIGNDGRQLSFRFEGGGLLTYSLILHAHMSLWQVTEWIAPELGDDDAIRSIQLCNLDARIGIINALFRQTTMYRDGAG